MTLKPFSAQACRLSHVVHRIACNFFMPCRGVIVSCIYPGLEGWFTTAEIQGDSLSLSQYGRRGSEGGHKGSCISFFDVFPGCLSFSRHGLAFWKLLT